MLNQYNKDTIKGEWKDFKGAIKKKWGKLTDDELMQIEGEYDQLSGRLQKVYGYSKERAESEIEDVWAGFKDRASDMKDRASNILKGEGKDDTQPAPNTND